MADMYNGTINLKTESVRDVLKGMPAIGYEARKAERFFADHPEAGEYAKTAVEYLSLEVAQNRFEIFCKFSGPGRELVKDLYLEKIKEEAGGEKELALAQ
jgi:hypothetical protein